MSTPRKIRLADLSSDAITVELDEQVYQLRETTRSVQLKLNKALKALNDAETDEDGDPDKSVGALAECLDVMLAPQGDAPAAKKFITDAWKADKLSVAQLSGLFENLQEAATSRPT
jgi:hypothetical protein